jgi:hypothetical protein
MCLSQGHRNVHSKCPRTLYSGAFVSVESLLCGAGLDVGLDLNLNHP